MAPFVRLKWHAPDHHATALPPSFGLSISFYHTLSGLRAQHWSSDYLTWGEEGLLCSAAGDWVLLPNCAMSARTSIAICIFSYSGANLHFPYSLLIISRNLQSSRVTSRLCIRYRPTCRAWWQVWWLFVHVLRQFAQILKSTELCKNIPVKFLESPSECSLAREGPIVKFWL